MTPHPYGDSNSVTTASASETNIRRSESGKCKRPGLVNGGGGGIRIPVDGFAVHCLATRPHHPDMNFGARESHTLSG